jgi:hypothetical protein
VTDTADLEAMVAALSPEERKQVIKVTESTLKRVWRPHIGPQMDAFFSPADVLLYGGAAGGGKTDLLLGFALTEAQRSVIFRRAYVDLRAAEDRLLEIIQSRRGYNASDMVFKSKEHMVEFGALEKPGSELSWQGRAHDFIGFDEGAQLSREKVMYVMGWLRSTKKHRKRVVIATNPPIGGEGEWIIEWFAPWLDPLFTEPAKPGEIRWCMTMPDASTKWMEGPGETTINGEKRTHESRTFIPAFLDDNPDLKDKGYRARLENMPEPLRSQLLYGDFMAGRQDHEWQVIPTDWVRSAQERWRREPEKRRTMVSLAMDVAMGGADLTTVAKLYEDAWFAPIVERTGVNFNDPAQHASLLIQEQRDAADISVDATGGWGVGVASHLKHMHNLECYPIVFSKQTMHKAKDGKLGFKNLRAEMFWRLREALSPDSGDDLKLPPSARLLAQLTTPRYTIRGTDILIESKDDIRKRLGSSTDWADAIVMAWHRRGASIKRGRLTVPGFPPLADYDNLPTDLPWNQPDAWMAG